MKQAAGRQRHLSTGLSSNPGTVNEDTYLLTRRKYTLVGAAMQCIGAGVRGAGRTLQRVCVVDVG